jgi:hypothetical protein
VRPHIGMSVTSALASALQLDPCSRVMISVAE